MALCQPFCAANQMAAAATSVLPLPTSTLQQTVHRGLAAQIMADFFRRAALCPGGCIGQAAPERRKVQLPHGGTGNFAAMAPHQKYAQLQDIQFFKDQTAAGSGSICRVPRGMDGPHSVRFGRHAVAGQQLWRQRVIQLGHIFQRQLGAAGQAGGGQPFGASVNRQQGRRSNLGFGAHSGAGFPAGSSCRQHGPRNNIRFQVPAFPPHRAR